MTLHATFEGAGAHSRMGTVAGFSASAELDREAWGITWNQAIETGGWVVGRTIRVDIDAEIVREDG